MSCRTSHVRPEHICILTMQRPKLRQKSAPGPMVLHSVHTNSHEQRVSASVAALEAERRDAHRVASHGAALESWQSLHSSLTLPLTVDIVLAVDAGPASPPGAIPPLDLVAVAGVGPVLLAGDAARAAAAAGVGGAGRLGHGAEPAAPLARAGAGEGAGGVVARAAVLAAGRGGVTLGSATVLCDTKASS